MCMFLVFVWEVDYHGKRLDSSSLEGILQNLREAVKRGQCQPSPFSLSLAFAWILEEYHALLFVIVGVNAYIIAKE